MSVITDIYNWVVSLALIHPILIAFLSGFLGGEEILLVLGFASAQGIIPFHILLIFCTLGAYIMDFFIFLIGKSKMVNRLHKWRKFSEKYKKIDMFVGKVTKEKHILLLFYTKFIYGTRIVSLLFLGLKGIKTLRFLVVSLFTVVIWSSIILIIGWLAGRGFSIILTVFKSLSLAVSFVVLFIILLWLLKRKVEKKLVSNQKK